MPLSPSGPYVSAALLCEKVLIEQDNTPTLVRVIDRLITNTITINIGNPQGPTPPQPEVEPFNLTLFISFKSGDARGKSTVKIELEAPNGIKRPPQELPVLFEGEDRGVNLILPFKMKPDMEGLYWFNISLDDEFITRIPLKFIHQRSVINQ